eukprot:scaffold27021_cov160-Isochrysis_galbana.AAC.2
MCQRLLAGRPVRPPMTCAHGSEAACGSRQGRRRHSRRRRVLRSAAGPLSPQRLPSAFQPRPARQAAARLRKLTNLDTVIVFPPPVQNSKVVHNTAGS